MKDYKPRYEELYRYYQVWLTDFTVSVNGAPY